jgi:hypothetical protein
MPVYTRQRLLSSKFAGVSPPRYLGIDRLLLAYPLLQDMFVLPSQLTLSVDVSQSAAAFINISLAA